MMYLNFLFAYGRTGFGAPGWDILKNNIILNCFFIIKKKLLKSNSKFALY